MGEYKEAKAVYDVLYMDQDRGRQVLASGLAREAACERARTEARRRRVGRMFLAGSEPRAGEKLVVIVDSPGRA
jgi:hypothetical protein